MKRPTGLKVYRALLTQGEVQGILDQEESVNKRGELFRLFGSFGGKSAQPVAAWMRELGEQMRARGLFSAQPNQFRLCDWIGEHSAQFKWHIDNNRHGEEILVIGLSDARKIGFRKRGGKDSYELDLSAGDAYMIQGPARWSWEHCVLPHGKGRGGGRSFVMSYKRGEQASDLIDA